MDINNIITDIPDLKRFIRIEPIYKGWSNDKKYYIETNDDRRFLLRVSDIAEYDLKKAEFEMLQCFDKLRIPMSHPIDFGVNNNCKNVYSLLTWCDGYDAEIVLPTMTKSEQYSIGVKSGEILEKLHSIPIQETQDNWAVRFNRKTNIKIKKYQECGIHFVGDDKVIEYIENNRSLLEKRPQCYQHGDYHVGNMIIMIMYTCGVQYDGEKIDSNLNAINYSDIYYENYKAIYNDAFRPMRMALQLSSDCCDTREQLIKKQADIHLLIFGNDLIGSVATYGDEIDDLIVNPVYQRKGYGKKLLLFAINRLQNRGQGSIFLHVADWNTNAIDLYLQNGFKFIKSEKI